jgi:hypothetical protein
MTIFNFYDAGYVPSNESWYVFDRDIEPLPAYYALQHRLLGDTTVYQHNFDDPQVNPRITVPDMDWGVKPLVSSQYKILSSNYNGTGSWSITNGNTVLATLQSGNEFCIRISKLPTDKAYWNDSDYFHIEISGDGFINGHNSGNYSFYERWHFIRGTWYPGTPEWLRKIIPDGSRLTWDDWISNFQDHSVYNYSDSIPTFTNTDTTIGFHVKNEKMSLSTEWNKSSGVLTYYHYTGADSSGEMPLDLEFALDSHIITDTNVRVMPGKFILAQNYPNPFNPSTTIGFSIIDLMNVTLKIFDILGREIITLVNEVKPAGSYSVDWDGKNSAGQRVGSGVYFYQLKSGSGFTKTQKMVFLN